MARKFFGTINREGRVVEDSLVHSLPTRGTDKEGFPEVLIDATQVGGKNSFSRQSVKPFLGMRVAFIRIDDGKPFNFEILPEEEQEELPVQVGVLNVRCGIKGYKVAEPGHPVFEHRDRYFILLEHETLPPLKVTYYKHSLEKSITK